MMVAIPLLLVASFIVQLFIMSDGIIMDTMDFFITYLPLTPILAGLYVAARR